AQHTRAHEYTRQGTPGEGGAYAVHFLLPLSVRSRKHHLFGTPSTEASPGHFDGETTERPLRPGVCLLLRSTYCCRANTGRGNMVDREASSKRLEMRVKSLSSVTVAEEPNPSRDAATNMASPDVDHIGSMVGQEDAFPTGMRRRVIEPPLGSKIGYHELEDEKEDADEEWMTGEA
ncbi:unnamed protein product, partial [Ectocarpus sp. 12 AP-2014]